MKKREKTRNPHAEMKSAKTKPPDQAFQDPLEDSHRSHSDGIKLGLGKWDAYIMSKV